MSASRERLRAGKERRRTRFNERLRRQIASGRIFPYLAGMTLVLAATAGVTVRIIDHKDFTSLGNALWWAIVTLSTVGYGDIVPHSTWGRIVGSAVIILGITFISVLTATVTSYFVSANQEEFASNVADAAEEDKASDLETHRLLHELLDRVGVIEDKLDDRPREKP
jgi:voltage-gated potassium channel